MEITIKIGKMDNLSEIENLYDALNDYLSETINSPGWKKGVYPTREHAENDIKEGTLYVACFEGRIIGSIVLNDEPEQDPVNGSWLIEAKHSEVLNVHRLAVHPEFLRYGIASMMLEFADSLAKEKKLKSIRLDVYEGNVSAIRLYEKCGYAYIDTVDIGLGCYGLDWFRLYEKVVV